MNELKLLGKTTIQRKDFDGKPSYSIGFSEKNKEDDTWINSYMPVTFKGGAELRDKDIINITNSFLKPYKGKSGGQKVIVMEFEKLTVERPETPEGFDEVDDCDIPFA